MIDVITLWNHTLEIQKPHTADHGETAFPEYRITLIDRGDNVNDYRGKREGIKRIL